MKILFLDIDGVLNNEGTFTKSPQDYFPIEPYCAFLVGKIQLDTDCKVVLSSSWRHHQESVEHLHNRIINIYDQTPNSDSGIRGEEIKAWIENSKYKVERYAILDDDSDMLPEQLPNFFKTDWKTGLTEEIARKVIEHLNKNTPD